MTVLPRHLSEHGPRTRLQERIPASLISRSLRHSRRRTSTSLTRRRNHLRGRLGGVPVGAADEGSALLRQRQGVRAVARPHLERRIAVPASGSQEGPFDFQDYHQQDQVSPSGSCSHAIADLLLGPFRTDTSPTTTRRSSLALKSRFRSLRRR